MGTGGLVGTAGHLAANLGALCELPSTGWQVLLKYWSRSYYDRPMYYYTIITQAAQKLLAELIPTFENLCLEKLHGGFKYKRLMTSTNTHSPDLNRIFKLVQQTFKYYVNI